MIQKIDLSITSNVEHGGKTQYQRVRGQKGFSGSTARTKTFKGNALKNAASHDGVRDYAVGNSKIEFSLSDTYTVRIQNKKYVVKVNVPTQDRFGSNAFNPKTVLGLNISRPSGALIINNRILKRRQWNSNFENYINVETVVLRQMNRNEISHKYVLHVEKLSATVLKNIFSSNLLQDRYPVSASLTAPSLTEHVKSELDDFPEALFNFDLHALEGVDMTQFTSPDQDRAVILNEWPRHLRVAPYKT
jgi:hypothetical protein